MRYWFGVGCRLGLRGWKRRFKDTVENATPVVFLGKVRY